MSNLKQIALGAEANWDNGIPGSGDVAVFDMVVSITSGGSPDVGTTGSCP